MGKLRIGVVGATPNPLTGAVAPELADRLPEGVRLVAYPSRVPVFPYTPLDRELQALGHIEAGLRAQAEGCDAVVLDTFGDYGLEVLQATLEIPAVGCGQAALAEAIALGGTFTLVTAWPRSMDFVPQRVLRDAGLEAACLSIRSVGEEDDLPDVAAPGGYLARIAAGEAGILERLVTACGDAAREDRAEVVVLGCTCLSPVAEAIARRSALPVVNPRLAGLTQAIRFAAEGVRRAVSPPRPESLAVLNLMTEAVAAAPPEECPTCVGDLLETETLLSRDV